MTEHAFHAERASGALEDAEQALPEEYEGIALSIATIAQAHATLALVEQQRIANLIAIVALDVENFEAGAVLLDGALHALIEYVRTPATPVSDPDDYPEIRPEIRQALWL